MVPFGNGFERERFFAFVGPERESLANGSGLKLAEAVVVIEVDLQLLVLGDDPVPLQMACEFSPF